MVGSRSRSRHPWWVSVALVAGLLALPGVSDGLEATASVDPVPATTTDGHTAVIVRGVSGEQAAAVAAVRALGGTVTTELAVIDGAAALVPTGTEAVLEDDPAIAAVTPDAPVHTMSGADNDGMDRHRGHPRLVRDVIDVDEIFDRDQRGRGIDVALIDSGVAPLDGPFRFMTHGPDLSFENDNPALAHHDTYGHGTHMASILAGAYWHNYQAGIAPHVNLINIKVADATGASDVSQVIAGIDWVVANRTTEGRDIRVLNLSLGTDTDMDPAHDPLSYAAQNAWDHGIVVVAAAGNHGNRTGRLLSPARNPNIIAVAAADTNGTVTVSDDVIPWWSARAASGNRNVDVTAPGRSIRGLRAEGTWLEMNHPTARYKNYEFLGSGTSQAAAIVSGAVAILLQQHPELTPDQVKHVLVEGANSFPANRWAQGAGMIDIGNAMELVAAGDLGQPQDRPRSDGTGSIEAARGTTHVTKDDVTITGEVTAHGQDWNGRAWAEATASGSSWQGSSWQGSSWQGSSWQGSSWQGSSWQGSSWQGSSWQGSSWQGSSWQGAMWSSAFWD